MQRIRLLVPTMAVHSEEPDVGGDGGREDEEGRGRSRGRAPAPAVPAVPVRVGVRLAVVLLRCNVKKGPEALPRAPKSAEN